MLVEKFGKPRIPTRYSIDKDPTFIEVFLRHSSSVFRGLEPILPLAAAAGRPAPRPLRILF